MTGKHVLSPAEKYMVVKVYNYFQQEKDEAKPGASGLVRDRVHNAMGFSTSVISGIMKNWGEHGDLTFAEVLFALPKAMVSTTYHLSYHISMCDINVQMGGVEEAGHLEAKQRASYSSPETRPEAEHGVQTCYRQYPPTKGHSSKCSHNEENLRNMGMRYIRGKTWNALVESEGTVAFRATYIDKTLSNRDARAIQHSLKFS